ncbi:MAG: hypothetical protein GWP19_06620 [Planctomycetia bacterium]|nr:hypothetical protein [Planctomycetia bacterium]
MKLIQIVVYIIFFMLLFSCNKLWPPEEPPVTTTVNELSDFQMIISDTGSVIFKNNDDLLLKNKDVKEIILISKDGEIFEDLKIIEPTYAKVGNKYKLEFEITTPVEPEVYIKHYILKFNMVDDSYIDINKTAILYKYPYENAEIFMLPEEMVLLGGGGYIQDFDIVENYLYYHPYGPMGLYRYNLSMRTAPDTLRRYEAGDHIAVAANYVFIDYAHSRIERYNTDSDSIDLIFDLSQISWADCDYYCSNLGIYGLAANNDIVYALVNNYDADDLSVIMFDYEGTFLNETPYPEFYGYNLEYYNGILFSYYYDLEDQVYTIKRFDLNSNSFLETKLSPTPSPDGISIVNGRFYYADYYRKIICSIPMADLMD